MAKGDAPRQDVLEALDGIMARRRSCRAFSDRQVDKTVIERILVSAQSTASWSNTQPWNVTIVSGAALETIRAEMFERAGTPMRSRPDVDWPREIRGVYQQRRRACGWALYKAVGIERGDRAASSRMARENFRFFGAPHLALVTSDEALGTHGVMDAGGWVSSFMLCAAAVGVATLAQAALAAWPDIWRKHLAIPNEQLIICGISFGFPVPDAPANNFRTARAPINEFVRWVGEPGTGARTGRGPDVERRETERTGQ